MTSLDYSKNQPATIYLDHSATTPTDPRVVEAMLPYFTTIYGNVSSAHRIGQQAHGAVEKSRETIADILNCTPDEIIFTSGGSESDNLAVRGVGGRHFITTPIEHSAIGKTICQLAEKQGAEYTLLPVDDTGKVYPQDLREIIRRDTGLVSVMYANNEVGTVQPIAELAAVAHERCVLFHTDAVQAAGQLPLDVRALDVDLLSLSAHKFYGPKGIGALYVRKGVKLSASQTGGGQEFGYRAGTHATPLIVGLAKALELAYAEYDTRVAHYQGLRDRLIRHVLNAVPGAILTGHPTDRLASHASFIFEGIHGQFLIDALDSQGIAASGASACKAGSHAPSSVLLALGYSPELASASLRLTVGVQTTPAEIDEAVGAILQCVGQLSRVVAA